jgi:signal transduction histidine kinase
VHGGKNVVIEIIDNGTGITADDLSRVMETFFTTKSWGKGTGLGLPICRRIVEAHGGSLSIESEPGQGTTVRIVLPAEGEEGRAHDK